MKTTNFRLHSLSAIILFSTFLLISCTKVTYPEPSENPVLLTYEAQTKKITVENMVSIAREDATDEKIVGDDYITIQNDWVSFTKSSSFVPKNTLKIVVKENTTGEPRSHTVSLKSGTKNTILTVTQAGKP